jgi:hypothetical protein
MLFFGPAEVSESRHRVAELRHAPLTVDLFDQLGPHVLSPHDDPTMPRHLGQQEDMPETRRDTPPGVRRGTWDAHKYRG